MIQQRVQSVDLLNLKDFSTWKDSNPELTLLGYVYHNLSADLAIAVTKLFWPDVLEFSRGVFLAEGFSEEAFQEWMRQSNGALETVEQKMNLSHVVDLIRDARNLNQENLTYLGDLLMECWQAKLRSEFPDRTFKIMGGYSPEEEDFTITFYQVRASR